MNAKSKETPRTWNLETADQQTLWKSQNVQDPAEHSPSEIFCELLFVTFLFFV